MCNRAHNKNDGPFRDGYTVKCIPFREVLLIRAGQTISTMQEMLMLQYLI